MRLVNLESVCWKDEFPEDKDALSGTRAEISFFNVRMYFQQTK